jgi:hypothetical protein
LDDFDLAADPDGTAVVAFPGPDGLSVAERAPGAPFAAISAVSRANGGVAHLKPGPRRLRADGVLSERRFLAVG